MINNKTGSGKVNTGKVISWLLVILWAGVIFYLSSRTADESTVQSRGMISSFAGFFGTVIDNEELMINIDGIVRESAHGVEYFILGVLVCNASGSAVLSLILCMLYALSDEIHQIPIPGRAFQIMDLLIDFAGIVIGIVFLICVKRFILRRRQRNACKE